MHLLCRYDACYHTFSVVVCTPVPLPSPSRWLLLRCPAGAAALTANARSNPPTARSSSAPGQQLASHHSLPVRRHLRPGTRGAHRRHSLSQRASTRVRRQCAERSKKMRGDLYESYYQSAPTWAFPTAHSKAGGGGRALSAKLSGLRSCPPHLKLRRDWVLNDAGGINRGGYRWRWLATGQPSPLTSTDLHSLMRGRVRTSLSSNVMSPSPSSSPSPPVAIPNPAAARPFRLGAGRSLSSVNCPFVQTLSSSSCGHVRRHREGSAPRVSGVGGGGCAGVRACVFVCVTFSLRCALLYFGLPRRGGRSVRFCEREGVNLRPKPFDLQL